MKKAYVNENVCIGCGTCMLVCQLGALILDTTSKKTIKCDLCQDEEVRYAWPAAPM